MPRFLKLYVASVVAIGAIALIVATPLFKAEPGIALRLTSLPPAPPTELELALGVVFWTILTLVGSAFPVQLPRGTHQAVAVAPIMASMFLGGPAVGGWVAAIGTTEMRELRGRIPWYGTLANHAGLVIPAILAGTLREGLLAVWAGPAAEFVTAMVAAAVFMSTNLLLVSLLLGLRTGQPVLGVLVGDSRGSPVL